MRTQPLTKRSIIDHMFPLLCCVVFLWAAIPEMAGQRRFDQSKELGLALGTGYYLGDLNPGNT